MKVKCISSGLPGLCEGEEYNLDYEIKRGDGVIYVVTNEGGCQDTYHRSHFTITPENPQIEVGSEWVNEDGETVIIKYSSEYTIVSGDTDECREPETFLDYYKPKTKAVTMYFYTDCKGLTHAYSEPMPVFGDYKFTREIEL